MILVTEPVCELDGLNDLQLFIVDNEVKLESEQGYQLERIYKTINSSLEDVRKTLKQMKQLDNIEDMKEYLEDILDGQLFSLEDIMED